MNKQLGMMRIWKIPLPVVILIVAAVVVVAALLLSSGPSGSTPVSGPGPQIEVIGETGSNQTETAAEVEEAEDGGDASEAEEQVPDDLRADLVGISISYSGGSINAVIANEGYTDAGSFKVEFLKGKNRIGIVAVDGIDAGENKTVSLSWEPGELDVGNKQINIEIDLEEKVDEISERNNDYSEYVEIGESGSSSSSSSDNIESGVATGSGVEDISDELVNRIVNYYDKWYFRSGGIAVPPSNVDQYYDISRDSGDTYVLGIAIAGFKIEKDMGIPKAYVPVSSVSGWSSSSQIGEDPDSDTCIWMGPRIVFDLEIDDNYLEISDNFLTVEKINVGNGKRIKSVKFLSAKMAEFDEEITMARCAGGPTPNELVPNDFYYIEGDKIYFYPVQWNPDTKETVGYFHVAFEIELD